MVNDTATALIWHQWHRWTLGEHDRPATVWVCLHMLNPHRGLTQGSVDETETWEVVSYYARPPSRSVKELRCEYSRAVVPTPLTLHLIACFNLFSRAKAGHQVFLAQGHSAGHSRAKLVSFLPSRMWEFSREKPGYDKRAVPDRK